MKLTAIRMGVVGGLLLAGLVAGVAELSGAWRAAVYAGGGAELVVCLVGLCCAAKLAGLPVQPGNDSRFWAWWGGGMLARLALGLGAALAFKLFFRNDFMPALLALAGTYLAGLLVETAWLAQELSRKK